MKKINEINFKEKNVFIFQNFSSSNINDHLSLEKSILEFLEFLKKPLAENSNIFILTNIDDQNFLEMIKKNLENKIDKPIEISSKKEDLNFSKKSKILFLNNRNFKNSFLIEKSFLAENIFIHNNLKDSFLFEYYEEIKKTLNKNHFINEKIEKEFQVLEKFLVTDENTRPSVAIFSSSSILSGIKELNFLLKKFDRVILGDTLSHLFLIAANPILKNNSFNEKEIFIAKKFLENRKDRLILPIDFKKSLTSSKKILFDIGPKTIQKYKPYILAAKKILWIGAVGNAEVKSFQYGTKQIIEILNQKNGDSLIAIYGKRILNLLDEKNKTSFYHISKNNFIRALFLENKINQNQNLDKSIKFKIFDAENAKTILKVKNLKVSFKSTRKKIINIIRGVDLSVKSGQIIGFVGESGSGKSVTSKSLININFGAIVDADKMDLDGKDLLSFSEENDWNKIRGKLIGYIPQDPLTSLNPTRTIGKQLLDCLKNDSRFETKNEKIEYIVNLLETFGIRNASEKLKSYPHTLSGGQKQRIVIAMVVAKRPKIIIADEPTTALDPTVQASVLALFEKIRQEFKISIIFISHNISVVAKFCDYIYVMYAGRIVERGLKKEIFQDPKHPYTWALINSIPENKEEKLFNIKGLPPDMANLPAGDPFASRNDYALEIDFEKEPPLFWINKTHAAATWLLHPSAPKVKIDPKLQERINIFKEVFNE